MTVARKGASAGQEVVEERSRTDVEALPQPSREWIEERDRLHEVWAQSLEEQRLLRERLPDQAEIELLEVAEPAMDQLARTARGARGPVALLDQRDGEAPAGGVEGRARTDHAPADHDEVEGLVPDALEVTLPLGRIESGRIHVRFSGDAGAKREGSARGARTSAEPATQTSSASWLVVTPSRITCWTCSESGRKATAMPLGRPFRRSPTFV